MVRSLLLVPLLLLAGCREASITTRAPTGEELAGVLGTVQTLDLTPPRGARTYALSQGMQGPLEGATQDGRLPVTVGLLQDGCTGTQRRLVVRAGGTSSSSCLNLPSAYGVTASLAVADRPLPLNRWVPVYAVQPSVPGQREGSQVMDDDPEHWTLISVYFSTEADPAALDPPDTSTALELLR